MPIDKTHLSIRMVEGRHLHRCFTDAKEHGEDLKIAITVGVHPAISIAGAYQFDWGKDEINIANSLLGGKLTLDKTSILWIECTLWFRNCNGREKFYVIKCIQNGW